MKKHILLTTLILLVVLSWTAAAEKTFFWYDMMESARLKYTAGHGVISYYIQPFEFYNSLPIEDGFEQQVELTICPTSYLEATGYVFFTPVEKTLSGTLKASLLNKNGFILSVRGGTEYYMEPNYNKIVSDLAILTELALTTDFKLHNNAEIRINQSAISSHRFENGFSFNLNPYNNLKANFNSNFDQNGSTYSVEGAYKITFTNKASYVFYITKRLTEENIHFENIFEMKPAPTLTLKGNLIHNTVETSNTFTNYAGTWIGIKAEQGYYNMSVFADFEKQIKQGGYRSLRVGVNLKL